MTNQTSQLIETLIGFPATIAGELREKKADLKENAKVGLLGGGITGLGAGITSSIRGLPDAVRQSLYDPLAAAQNTYRGQVSTANSALQRALEVAHGDYHAQLGAEGAAHARALAAHQAKLDALQSPANKTKTLYEMIFGTGLAADPTAPPLQQVHHLTPEQLLAKLNISAEDKHFYQGLADSSLADRVSALGSAPVQKDLSHLMPDVEKLTTEHAGLLEGLKGELAAARNSIYHSAPTRLAKSLIGKSWKPALLGLGLGGLGFGGLDWLFDRTAKANVDKLPTALSSAGKSLDLKSLLSKTSADAISMGMLDDQIDRETGEDAREDAAEIAKLHSMVTKVPPIPITPQQPQAQGMPVGPPGQPGPQQIPGAPMAGQMPVPMPPQPGGGQQMTAMAALGLLKSAAPLSLIPKWLRAVGAAGKNVFNNPGGLWAGLKELGPTAKSTFQAAPKSYLGAAWEHPWAQPFRGAATGQMLGMGIDDISNAFGYDTNFQGPMALAGGLSRLPVAGRMLAAGGKLRNAQGELGLAGKALEKARGFFTMGGSNSSWNPARLGGLHNHLMWTVPFGVSPAIHAVKGYAQNKANEQVNMRLQDIAKNFGYDSYEQLANSPIAQMISAYNKGGISSAIGAGWNSMTPEQKTYLGLGGLGIGGGLALGLGGYPTAGLATGLAGLGSAAHSLGAFGTVPGSAASLISGAPGEYQGLLNQWLSKAQHAGFNPAQQAELVRTIQSHLRNGGNRSELEAAAG